ncbi:MAG: hypothetical protein NXH75_12225, partial [Halobacteriovoraceae bacterium]|nr:hypothetical protein [Halobacteriovoraceae bacterium]
MKAQVALFYYSTKLLNSSFGRILQGMLLKWRLSKLLRFVRQHSSFYKNLTSLSNAPVMSKNLMMENFDFINTVGLEKDKAFNFYQKSEEAGVLPVLNDITIGMSTGTSGSRGLFL